MRGLVLRPTNKNVGVDLLHGTTVFPVVVKAYLKTIEEQDATYVEEAQNNSSRRSRPTD